MEINNWGKLLAGFFLILFSVAAVVLIMGYWPNKMPQIGKGDDAWYKYRLFKMELIEQCDSMKLKQKNDSIIFINNNVDSMIRIKDSLLNGLASLIDAKQREKDSINASMINAATIQKNKKIIILSTDIGKMEAVKKIHLNTIILILVALMGFLGNMVHVSSSFTAFVGNQTFKRSWILWYFVKPFTAAALALVIYFIIRAGFFNYGSDASTVSIYGVLSLAALAGLFTDKATLKLEEIFNVIFRAKDERKDKLEGDAMKLISVLPEKIDVNNVNQVVIKGNNFSKEKMPIKINDAPLTGTVVITPTTIEFDYTVLPADKAKTEFVLTITKSPTDILKHVWKV